MTFVKRKLLAALSNTDLLAIYSLRKYGYLAQSGWFKSWRTKRSIDAEGKPIPWITYPCLSFLKSRVTSKMEVFEFGCGNSTLWWAERVTRVVCCEHDPEWYSKMKNQIGINVQLELRQCGPDYAEFIEQFSGRFHVVVIDGRDRVSCIKHSLGALASDGVLLLDNSERHQYSSGIDFLVEKGFRRLDFEGPIPIVTESSMTTIFYKKDNCLNI